MGLVNNLIETGNFRGDKNAPYGCGCGCLGVTTLAAGVIALIITVGLSRCSSKTNETDKEKNVCAATQYLKNKSAHDTCVYAFKMKVHEN